LAHLRHGTFAYTKSEKRILGEKFIDAQKLANVSCAVRKWNAKTLEFVGRQVYI